MRVLKNLSVFGQIISLSVILILLTGVVAFFSFTETSILNERDDARRLENSIHKAHNFEIQFFRTRNMEAAEMVYSEIDQVITILSNYKDDKASVELLNYAEAYLDTFKTAVVNMKERGLDENSGAEGALRNSVHEIEGILKGIDDDAIMVEMLMARRSEKDFIMRGSEKYIGRVKKAVDGIKENTAKTNAPEELKENIYKLADEYYYRFVHATDLMNHNNRLETSLSEIALNMEEPLHKIVEQKESEAVVVQSGTITAIILAVIIGLGLALWISSVISKPIKRLIGMAEEVADGNYNVNVQLQTQNEVGHLADCLNKMVTEIRSSHEALVEEKQSIEQKIHEAIEAEEEERKYLQESVDVILGKMDSFANGDLSVQLAIDRNGEIGKLFKGFNRSVQNINKIVYGVNDSAHSTAKASADIIQSANHMAESIERQSYKITNAAGALEEMSAKIEETSNSANQAAESARKAGETATKGGDVVKQTIHEMEEIENVVMQAADNVEGLNNSSNKIKDIVQVIRDIADQTNLLALNAAIEAARAGENGRGFAVVADEVRKLSERTQKATAEIAGMIKSINEEITVTAASIKNGTFEVEKGKALVNEAGRSLEDIIGSSKEVIDLIAHVASSTEEQSMGVSQITSDLELIETETRQSSEQVKYVADISNRMHDLTQQLQVELSKFKSDDRLLTAAETEHRYLTS